MLFRSMENFGAKAARFLAEGRIAVGLKYSRESMEIVEHIGEIHIIMEYQQRIPVE